MAPPPVLAPDPVPFTLNFPKDGGLIAAGRGHSCVLSDGRVACWGSNDYGQLGDGPRNRASSQASSPADYAFSQVSAGWNHTCGLTTGDEIVCWGSNSTGQLGDGTTQPRNAPVRINSTASFRLVQHRARTHVCRVELPDRLLLGVEHRWPAGRRDAATPEFARQRGEIPGQVTDLTVGRYHTCALTRNGEAWCWGQERIRAAWRRLIRRREPADAREVRRAVREHQRRARRIPAPSRGERRVVLGKEQPTGSSGFSGAASCSTPHAVTTTAQFSTISAGLTFTCARGKESSAWCWGYNNYGQLGDGTLASRTVPPRR